MKRVIALFVCLLLVHGWAAAQKQNNIWTFANLGGFNFNGNTLTQFPSSMSGSLAGAASVADRNGNLLFYSDGLKIWDRNNNVMPNGNGLMNGQTYAYESQNVAIVPSVADSNRYFVFYVAQYFFDWPGAWDNQLDDKLYYSVVDVTLNNGLGDVVPGQKDVVVDSGFATALTTFPGRRCNVWLVTHMRDTNVFKAYSITGAGVSSPVYSKTGNYTGLYAYQTCVMKASSNDSLIGLTNFTVSITPGEDVASAVELYSFDTATGIVGNCKLIDYDLNFDFNNFYGICFSPDNTKLYAVELASGVYQYDLSAPTLTAITASKYNVSSSFLRGDVGLAPDGKIYVGSYSIPLSGMDCITNPNGAGAACNFVANAVNLNGNATTGMAFPQKVNWPYRDTAEYSHDTLLCPKELATLQCPWPGDHYLWQDQSITPAFDVSKQGIYWVRSWDLCHLQTDTFHVDTSSLHVVLGNDTTFCIGEKIVLDVTSTNATYLWNNGSNASTLTVDKTGEYSVHVTEGRCTAADTIDVTVNPLPVVDLGPNKVLCTADIDTISLPTDNGMTYRWQDGHTGPEYYVKQAGVYSVTAELNGCTAMYSVAMNYQPCDCPVFIPDAFTPNGDGRNDQLHAIASCETRGFQIQIFNRWGQLVYVGYNIKDGWDGTFNGSPAEIGTYFYVMSFDSQYRQKVERKGDITLIR
ncbi:gliding motility-associated C-terminal domain-containing protein [Taibaiella soli]|uniref:Gliding motility-associated C-terminal domain-containing protein n=1 Tax=Taibaiella soli TaxID=1649169 RepID=A0A2W2B0B8_9BACT|nr:gliding motility-associated C-terminal domain-containing protein [Taibaiella soli]PZF73704.1 hypothetical protein DN068_06830 [Taibaiella soli]